MNTNPAEVLRAALALTVDVKVQVIAYDFAERELTVYLDSKDRAYLLAAYDVVGAALANFGYVGRRARTARGKVIWFLEIGEMGYRKIQSDVMRVGFVVRLAA